MTLEGRVAILTGGKRIGAVVALTLAERGCDLVLTYRRSEQEAEETVAAARRIGRRAIALPADLSDSRSCQDVVDRGAKELGRLDVLINMASVYFSKPFDELTDRDWFDSLNVDLSASYFCARAVIPHLRQSGGGRIINFSDWLALSHRPRYKGFLPYYVAKVAVIGLTEALALELANQNILVNAIAPGPILPASDLKDEDVQKVAAVTPVGYWGGEKEVAKLVVSLIESDFITGETIRIDGGRHIY